MTCVCSMILHALLIATTLGAAGQLDATDQDAAIKLTLYPAASPTPALKYQLLPGVMERRPGNAAVHYGKVTAEEIRFFSDQELRENYHRWLDTPLEELRRNPVHLPSLGGIEDSLRRAACSEYCDWQLPIGDEPLFPMLLPEVQQMREFGRILGVRARLQIVNGRFDEAMETLQNGYAAARNVGTGETIVNGLVGIAIGSTLNQQLLDFVQQPDSPNLYWALTMLPQPLIDMRAAMEVEAHGIELTFLELRDPESMERDAEEWRDLFHQFASEVLEWTANREFDESLSPEQLDEACQRVLPAAKGLLVERGMPQEKVAAMPLHQVALLYTFQLHHELLDDGIKFYFLPYPQAIEGINAAIEKAEIAAQESREFVPISQRSLSAIRSARTATARCDRQIAALRLIEALRLYAAGHNGDLPKQLAELTDVPIPDDPVTGKPFIYRCDGDTAILFGPTLPNAPLKYVISIGRQ